MYSKKFKLSGTLRFCARRSEMGHLATPLFRAYQIHIKYNMNFKNQARVIKFEIIDAIDTRIKNIKKKFFRT